MKTDLLKNVAFIVLFMTAPAIYCLSQERIAITTGLGLPDLANLGVRMNIGQTQCGMHAGIVPFLKDENIWTVGGEFCYHFAGTSTFTDLHPWYGRLGAAYLQDETTRAIFKDVYLDIRCGRVLNIKYNAGFELDAGIVVNILHTSKSKETSAPSLFNFEFYVPVFPAFGARWFFRF